MRHESTSAAVLLLVVSISGTVVAYSWMLSSPLRTIRMATCSLESPSLTYQEIKIAFSFIDALSWQPSIDSGEGLFTPKLGVRILNPQKIPWIFWIFSDFFVFLGFFRYFRMFWNFFGFFSGFFWMYEDFINKKGFKH